MPPRKMFSSPEQVQAVTPKSEPIARGVRAMMPGPTSTNPGFEFPGYEKRPPTEQEKDFIDRADRAVDDALRAFGIYNVPGIDAAEIRIHERLSQAPSMKEPFYSAVPLGHTSVFYDISLSAFRADRHDGARMFLHAAIHEFFHAKSNNRWNIGEKTQRRISGFHSTLSRTTTDERGRLAMDPAEDFFVGLTEAMTEMLTVIACEKLFATPWFQKTQRRGEARTASMREAYAKAHHASDAMIVKVSQNESGVVEGLTPYFMEQFTLKLIMLRISDAQKIPYNTVLKIFITDYIAGTMEHIKPLLRDTFGPDVLRVLSVWTPATLSGEGDDLFFYLKETNPHVRDVMANNYLTKRGAVPQMS
ncbi:MAG: hypothetical protein QX199_15760 [Methylococcaceae bacterium]